MKSEAAMKVLKTLFRLGMILVVTGLVTAGLYTFINTSQGRNLLSAAQNRATFKTDSNDAQAQGSQVLPTGRGINRRGEQQSGSLSSGLLGIAQKTGLIVLITLAVVLLQKLAKIVARPKIPLQS
jgi:hypothetical protein